MLSHMRPKKPASSMSCKATTLRSANTLLPDISFKVPSSAPFFTGAKTGCTVSKTGVTSSLPRGKVT